MTSETALKAKHIDEYIFQKTWSWWNIGAIFGLLGGMSAILIAVVLTLAMWLFKRDAVHISLQTVTNVLFYSAFPLLFFGAYCLDKIDEIVKKKSRQHFEK